MTRMHRWLHRVLWPILAVLVAIGFALALWLRPPPETGQTRLFPAATTLERFG